LARAFLALYRVDPNACLGYPRVVPVAPPWLNHSLHALFISILLADHLEFSEAQIESLAAAALTMNMSDIALHERIHDGLFASSDWTQLRRHPTDTANLLARAGVTDLDWLNSVQQHHENMDGSGYPANLTGAQISLAARVLHVADVYCGKISARSYRPPKSPRLAFKTLFGTERTQIDMQIASLLLRRIGLLPPGTLVRLSNRETACITGLGRNGQVMFGISFLDARGNALESPRERNLSSRAYAIRYPVDADPVWPKINWSTLWGY
jgi:HD-GYP domain-containing protein (c-di-GMP phosphodiesterase class II)